MKHRLSNAYLNIRAELRREFGVDDWAVLLVLIGVTFWWGRPGFAFGWLLAAGIPLKFWTIFRDPPKPKDTP